jgi:hypothetical protein
LTIFALPFDLLWAIDSSACLALRVPLYLNFEAHHERRNSRVYRIEMPERQSAIKIGVSNMQQVRLGTTP